MAKASPGMPAADDCTKLITLKRLFKLSYIKFRQQETTLLHFNADVTIDVAVTQAKELCSQMNARFMYLEPAIHELEV